MNLSIQSKRRDQFLVCFAFFKGMILVALIAIIVTTIGVLSECRFNICYLSQREYKPIIMPFRQRLIDELMMWPLVASLGIGVFVGGILAGRKYENLQKQNESRDQISFDKDSQGIILPTLRNKNTVDQLIKIYESRSKIPESFKEDVDGFFFRQALWNNKNGTDWYSTPETATRMHQAKVLTAELDKKYHDEKII